MLGWIALCYRVLLFYPQILYSQYTVESVGFFKMLLNVFYNFKVIFSLSSFKKKQFREPYAVAQARLSFVCSWGWPWILDSLASTTSSAGVTKYGIIMAPLCLFYRVLGLEPIHARQVLYQLNYFQYMLAFELCIWNTKSMKWMNIFSKWKFFV